jgi:hypothetical protein
MRSTAAPPTWWHPRGPAGAAGGVGSFILAFSGFGEGPQPARRSPAASSGRRLGRPTTSRPARARQHRQRQLRAHPGLDRVGHRSRLPSTRPVRCFQQASSGVVTSDSSESPIVERCGTWSRAVPCRPLRRWQRPAGTTWPPRWAGRGVRRRSAGSRCGGAALRSRHSRPIAPQTTMLAGTGRAPGSQLTWRIPTRPSAHP